MSQQAFSHRYRAIVGPLVAVGLLIAPSLSGLAAGQDREDGEWRAYAADKAGTKYSPLDQIDATNVNDLRIV